MIFDDSCENVRCVKHERHGDRPARINFCDDALGWGPFGPDNRDCQSFEACPGCRKCVLTDLELELREKREFALRSEEAGQRRLGL